MSAGSVVAKIAGGLTLAFGLVTGINYLCSPRITEREAAMEIINGRLADSDVEAGVKMDAWMPGRYYISLPTTLQKTSIAAHDGDPITIRAKEGSRVYGTFEVHFTIDKHDKNFGKAYTELKVDNIDDIKPFVNNYAAPAAIDVYQEIPILEVNKNLPSVGKKIKDKLQGYLNERGYTYIKILDVIPSGVGLSKDANDMLEQIVKEERKKALLITQGQVAEMSKAITLKQTDVTLEAINKLKSSGLTGDQAVELYYMQLLHVNDQLGKPNVPGPIPAVVGFNNR